MNRKTQRAFVVREVVKEPPGEPPTYQSLIVYPDLLWRRPETSRMLSLPPEHQTVMVFSISDGHCAAAIGWARQLEQAPKHEAESAVRVYRLIHPETPEWDIEIVDKDVVPTWWPGANPEKSVGNGPGKQEGSAS